MYYLQKMHFKYVKKQAYLTINTHLRQPLMTPYDAPCDMGPVQWCAGQDSVCGMSVSASVDYDLHPRSSGPRIMRKICGSRSAVRFRKRTGPQSALSSPHQRVPNVRHVTYRQTYTLVWSQWSVSCVLCALCACKHVVFGQCQWIMIDFSVCYVLINIHTYTTSALFQVRVPVLPVSVICSLCCNTSALSDGCSFRVPGLVKVHN